MLFTKNSLGCCIPGMATAMTSWKFLPREMAEPRALLPLIKSHLWKACIFTAGVTMIALSPICVHGNRKGNARALGTTQGLAQITLRFYFSSPGIHVNVRYLEAPGNTQLPPLHKTPQDKSFKENLILRLFHSSSW